MEEPLTLDPLDVDVLAAEAAIALEKARVALNVAVAAKIAASEAQVAARERYNRLNNLVTHLTACVRSGDLS